MSLQPKSYEAALARRKQGKRAHGQLKRKNWRGRKTRDWDAERIRLKKKFFAAGIVTCELRYAGCAFDNYLGFAHAKKRRNLSSKDLSVVILACNFCHDIIEVNPNMGEVVMNVIRARTVQP